MRVFLAGATGAIGRQLVPLLVRDGHAVTGFTRGEAGGGWLRSLGAVAVQGDIFDRDAVQRAVAEAAPDLVMHQLTALSERDFAANARIRREGTRNLVDAAVDAGVGHMVAQSIAWAYEPGTTPATETTPLDPTDAQPRAGTVGGIRALEGAVAEVGRHVILRYGTLYGPSTWYSRDGLTGQQLRKGELAGTEGVTSFVHIADAARAAVLALDWPSGVVNVVDDEPASGHDWVPALAAAVDAPQPQLKAGREPWERGADNSRARELGWRPEHPSWRTGFLA